VQCALEDSASGKVLARTESSAFIRGEGGFGGSRGDTEPWSRPERAPDHMVEYATRRDQALLYRLSGDRNPLHSDPTAATLAGFGSPILHGMASYGFAGRALLHALCDSDPASFGRISARFASTVRPGDRLNTQIWDDGDGQYRFVVTTGQTIVLDHGRFETRAA
jgi:acyl dehydratase